VGAYTPRDNEVSANFKQIKFAMQARKFDVAERLYRQGALRRELQGRAATLPAGLEEAIAAALHAGRVGEAERGLMVFFLALIQDLAAEADRQLAAAAPAPARAAAGRRILEAIWRYYNLVDFTVGQHDARAAAGIRLAFEEAEESVKDGSAAPERARAALARIARHTSEVIRTSSPARRDS
jgi:hypothetical protein